jgi:hypothetical protein
MKGEPSIALGDSGLNTDGKLCPLIIRHYILLLTRACSWTVLAICALLYVYVPVRDRVERD